MEENHNLLKSQVDIESKTEIKEIPFEYILFTIN